jgi:hypothetical protein
MYPVFEAGHAGVRKLKPLLRVLDCVALVQPRQLLYSQAFFTGLVEKTSQ